MVTLHSRRQPAGFTLIELLVVISIVALLAAISAGTFFRVRAGQQKSASEATVNKIQSALNNRKDAILASCKNDIVNKTALGQQALLATNDNPELAQTLLIYAKMKNELPMSFAEATTDTVFNCPNGIILRLPRRANFSVLPAGGNEYEQSAICLYLALSTSAGGGAVTDGAGFEQQIMDAPTITGFKVYKDTWGTPIAFARQAYTPETDGAPFVKGVARDPFDQSPGGLFKNYVPPAAPGSSLWADIIKNRPAFAQPMMVYPGSRNHEIIVIAAGADKNFGTNPFAPGDNDNLLSSRLRREGAKGD